MSIKSKGSFENKDQGFNCDGLWFKIVYQYNGNSV